MSIPRSVNPGCGCWEDEQRLRQREDEISEMIGDAGRDFYHTLTTSHLCPEAYMHAACRVATVLLTVAHAAALNLAGRTVPDDAVIKDVMAMLDDGTLPAGIRNSLMNARLTIGGGGSGLTVETRQ